MSDIAKFDPNFIVKTKVEREGMVWRNCQEEPFRIYGLMRENDAFCRMPAAVAKTVSIGVSERVHHSAGGRVRFVTDSGYIAIHAEFGEISKMSHMAPTGSFGFDLYQTVEDRTMRYLRTFVPPHDMENGYESLVELDGKELREITIHFPLYSEVKELYIGLDENAVLQPAQAYTINKPVVYYGSSITQGGCASKPGSSYQSILSEHLDCDYINLGFSGQARGEKEMADYVAGLDMSMFVLDYAYKANAQSLEELAEGHPRFYQTVRAAHPDLPILILPLARYYLDEVFQKAEDIIRSTYENARAAGDQNVYYISGAELMALVRDNGTVDNCHPTDSGFLSMANAIEPVMRKALYK